MGSNKHEIPSLVSEVLTSTPATHVHNHGHCPSPALPSLSTSRSGKSSDPSLLTGPIVLEFDWRGQSSADEDERQAVLPSLTVDHPPRRAASSHVITSVGPAAHALNAPTLTHTSSAVDSVDPYEREHEDQRGHDLTQDEPIDPTPFAFKPYHLASLDPKNLDSLEAMGGTEGLLAGLGTDPTNGLMISGKKSKSGYAPTTVVTTPAGEEFTHEGTAYAGTVEDRQSVYGSNVPPVRKSKSLLGLMSFALTDKVFVSLCHFRSPLNSLLMPAPPQAFLSAAAAISLAVGFSHDHIPGQKSGKPPPKWIGRVADAIAHSIPGPGREPMKLPDDWVEGVAIIVVILTVVRVCSLSHNFCALTPPPTGDGWLPQ